MKKVDLKKLAVLGIAGGLLFSASQAESAGYRQQNTYARNGCGGNGCGGHGDDDDQNGTENGGQNQDQSGYYTPDGEISEKGLMSQLSEESKKVYMNLDESEKQLVLRLAKQFQDKNAALRQAQKQSELEKSKDKVERPRRPITRHSLFR